MTNPRDTAIDDLELSVRAVGFLQALDITTVGDLMSLPVIEAPRWLVAELRFQLEELGLTYEGEWRSPPEKERRVASGTVQERLQTIAAWLEEENHHGVLASFRPPAARDAIALAEKELGLQLPSDYTEFLGIHDGQTPDAPMVEFCSLLPVDKLVSERAHLAKLFDGTTFEADERRPRSLPCRGTNGGSRSEALTAARSSSTSLLRPAERAGRSS